MLYFSCTKLAGAWYKLHLSTTGWLPFVVNITTVFVFVQTDKFKCQKTYIKSWAFHKVCCWSTFNYEYKISIFQLTLVQFYQLSEKELDVLDFQSVRSLQMHKPKANLLLLLFVMIKFESIFLGVHYFPFKLSSACKQEYVSINVMHENIFMSFACTYF